VQEIIMQGTSAKVSDRRTQGAVLGKMLREAVKHSLPGLDIGEIEMDYLAQLCAMSTVPTGDEDPKKLMRPLPDAIIDAVVLTAKTSITNPILSRLVKIFCIEWCFRHGHLHEDWKWEWKNPQEGQIHYRAKTPLNEIKELAF
jgi:hypothetical protein